MINKITCYIILLLSFYSCVDIIDLQLEETEQQPVIEAYINNNDFAQASVTMSSAYNDVLDFKQLEATVFLTDSKGYSEKLTKVDSSNIYQGSLIRGNINTSYVLEVQIDTSFFTSESSLSSPVLIDSFNCEYNEDLSEMMQMGSRDTENDEEEFYDSLYNINIYYDDPIDEENYYLARLARNGTIILDYNLSSDEDEDGEVQRNMFIEGFRLTDTVNIFLYSIDKYAYKYYQGLDDLSGSDIPYNPYTNIEGQTDVLGFFSARYVSSRMFYLREHAIFPSDSLSTVPNL